MDLSKFFVCARGWPVSGCEIEVVADGEVGVQCMGKPDSNVRDAPCRVSFLHVLKLGI